MEWFWTRGFIYLRIDTTENAYFLRESITVQADLLFDCWILFIQKSKYVAIQK